MMCNDDAFIVVLPVCGQGPPEHCYARVNIDIHNTDCNMLQYSQIRSHWYPWHMVYIIEHYVIPWCHWESLLHSAKIMGHFKKSEFFHAKWYVRSWSKLGFYVDICHFLLLYVLYVGRFKRLNKIFEENKHIFMSGIQQIFCNFSF